MAKKIYLHTGRGSARRREYVKNSVLGTGPGAKRTFSNLLHSFEVGSTKRRRTNEEHPTRIPRAMVNAKVATARPRQFRGYDIYVREQYNSDAAGIDFEEASCRRCLAGVANSNTADVPLGWGAGEELGRPGESTFTIY